MMPFPVLYLKSNVLSFLLYHVVRYRRKVVRNNLTGSFPEKSLGEIKRIEKRFYRNFCDIFLEICKLLTMKTETLSERVRFTNPELLKSLYDKGRNVLVVLPHSSNWEWFVRLLFGMTPHRCSAVYKPMENPYFDAFIHDMRSEPAKDDEPMIEDRKLFQVLEERRNTCNLLFFLGDQSPRGKETDYWTDFLHRDTCWYTGMERVAKMFDYVVVYGEMCRVDRGRYTVTFKMLCEEPQEAEDGFILEQYVRHVEQYINRCPDDWLWSHRRWKHSRKNKNA